MVYRDIEKEKAYRKKWRQNNRQKISVKNKLYKRLHPEQSSTAWETRNPQRNLLVKARNRAKNKNIECSIDESDIIIPDVCPLLGIPLVKGKGNPAAGSPSVDRIDPSKGYVKGNIWVISWRANKLKSDASLDELERLVLGLKSKLGAVKDSDPVLLTGTEG